MADIPDGFEESIPSFDSNSTGDNRKDAEWLSRIALLSAAGAVFGKSINRNFFAEAADKTGRYARYISSLGRRVDPEFPPETSDMLYKILGIHPDAGGKALTLGLGGGRAGELDSIQDLAEALRILQRPDMHSNRSGIEEVFTKHFQSLPRSAGSATPSGFHHDLQPLTFGEIMDNASDWEKNIGSLQFQTVGSSGRRIPLSLGVVEKATEMKWITRDTIVDSNLFTAKGGRVIDMRMTNPKKAVVQMSKMFDIAGVFKAASDFMKGGRAVAHITPGRDRIPTIAVGGNVYKSTSKGLVRTAENQIIGTTGDKRFQSAVLREASDNGSIGSLYTKDTGSGLYNTIQEATGVGTKFHDKQGVGLPFFKNVLRNISKVGTGDARFYGRDYKVAQEGILGRFSKPFAPEIDFVGATGAQFTKGKFHKQGLLRKSDLTKKERALAYMGMNPDVVVLNSEAALALKPNKGHITSHFGQSGIKSLDNQTGRRTLAQGATGVDQLGNLEYVERASHYATSGGAVNTAKDFGNYMAIRLNALASSTGLGIGFRPSGSLLGNTARLAAIPAAYMVLAEGVRYANYATEQVTGVNPMKTAAAVYTSARVAQQKIRESTGIAGAADYVETSLLPGLSVGLLGTAGALGAGIKMLGKGASYLKATGVGAAVYGAVGGPEVGQSSAELQNQYAGEELVPIRKARWWGLGYQPFKGGEIDHFAPSWYRKMIDQPGTVNTYGSEGNYWKNVSLLPTPSNLFGLKPLLDPYALEKRNYYNRPYPVTGGMLEEVPIFGPILADTIGAALKPKRTMHSQADMVASSNITERGVPENIGSQLGIPDLPNALVDLNRPDVLRDRVSKWTNVGLEPMGIWKFALQFFGVQFDENYTMADAGNMNSISRDFYGLNLGGLGGQTEFIRRFLMSDYGNPSKINQQVNPIPNTMPRWLPGSLGEYQEDRNYFVDFTRGDAYTKISGGEYRLPGAGYEAINRLHSGQAGVYDDVDKLMVLADVAPNSSAFHAARSGIESQQLSPYWAQKVDQALNNREKKLDRLGFNSQDIVAKANLHPLAQVVRSGWDSAYDLGSEIPLIGSKFMPRRQPLDHYVKFQVEGDTFADWQRPLETIVRPAIYDVMGSDPATATAKGALLGGLLAAPLAKFMNPFTPSTLSMGSNMIIGGAAGGLMGTARMVGTGKVSGGFVPNHVEREREVNQYFDYLQYSKYANLAEMSQSNPQLRAAFLRQSEKTTAYGLSTFQKSGDDSAYARSLGRTEREYFRAFKGASAVNRERILEYVPDHMKTVLSGLWSGRSGVASDTAHGAAQRSAAEYFESNGAPGSDWAGWHPGVPINAIKIKSIESGINGVSDAVHRFGYFPAQQREVANRFPFLEGIEDMKKKRKRNNHSAIYDAYGDYVPYGNVMGMDFGDGPNLDLQFNSLEDTRRDDVFSFFQLYR